MQHILYYWKGQFYTPLIKDIILIVTLWIAIKNRGKFPILKYMPVYTFTLLLASLALISAWIASDLGFYPEFFFGLDGYIDYLFTLVEMVIFSHFYYQLIKNRVVKRIILITNVLFIGFFVYMAIPVNGRYSDISEEKQAVVYTIESLILLFPCIYYVIELFKKQPTPTLKNQPEFWVSTGILFFMACTLPYSLLENYISKNIDSTTMAWYSIFHVFYILLFLMIIRAYLCKPAIE
jgi:hypothetical protein